MSQVLHVACKDSRQLRWALGAWMAFIAVRVLLDTNRPAMELAGPMTAIISTQLSSLMSFVELVAIGLIASLLVHEDPAVGRDAFWLTRPIDPAGLAVAKLMLGVGALVLLPLAGDLATLAFLDAQPGEMLRAVPSIFLSRASIVLPAFLAAAITPSLARFALLIVAALGALVVSVAILTTAVLLFANIDEGTPGLQVMTPLPGTIASSLAIAISAAVVIYQYRRRRLKNSVAFALCGLFIVMIGPLFWPRRAMPPSPDPGAWAHDEVRTTAVMEPDPANVMDEPPFQRRDRATKQIAAHVRLTGVPDEFTVHSAMARSRFQAAGATIESTSTGMTSVHLQSAGPESDVRPLQSVLAGARVWGRSMEPFGMWPVLLKLDDQQFAQVARTPGRLTADIDFHLLRYAADATAAVRSGPFFRDGGRRVEIVRIERKSDNCTVFFREIAIPALLTPSVFRQDELVLWNRRRNEAIRGDQNWAASGDTSPLGVLFGATLGMFGGTGTRGQGFGIRDYSIRYPSRGVADVPLDEAWLADAELVRVTADYAGRVTRSLTVDNFQIVR